MMSHNREVATLGGGCFWCLEAVFENLRGVERVVSGYAGGHVPNPTYRQVCGKTTGHAEVVQVTFDPQEISFRELLEVFFTIHDPATPNRQGADVGPQYRSIILYHSPEQKETADEVIAAWVYTTRWSTTGISAPGADMRSKPGPRCRGLAERSVLTTYPFGETTACAAHAATQTCDCGGALRGDVRCIS